MTTLAIRYIEAKYGNATRAELCELQQDCAKELREIKASKEKIFNDYTGVHGRFQHSQLDVLDIREQKICALFDNVTDLMVVRK